MFQVVPDVLLACVGPEITDIVEMRPIDPVALDVRLAVPECEVQAVPLVRLLEQMCTDVPSFDKALLDLAEDACGTGTGNSPFYAAKKSELLAGENKVLWNKLAMLGRVGIPDVLGVGDKVPKLFEIDLKVTTITLHVTLSCQRE